MVTRQESYGASPAVWDNTALSATEYRYTRERAPLNPVQGGYHLICLPQREQGRRKPQRAGGSVVLEGSGLGE